MFGMQVLLQRKFDAFYLFLQLKIPHSEDAAVQWQYLGGSVVFQTQQQFKNHLLKTLHVLDSLMQCTKQDLATTEKKATSDCSLKNKNVAIYGRRKGTG